MDKSYPREERANGSIPEIEGEESEKQPLMQGGEGKQEMFVGMGMFLGQFYGSIPWTTTTF